MLAWVMLNLNGSNITSLKDAQRHHLEVTYESMGCFIQHNALLVRPILMANQLNALYPWHNGAGLAALHISATTKHMKLTVKDNCCYTEMFCFIEHCVTVDAMDKVVSDAGYVAARNVNKNFFCYGNIIRPVHSLQMHNIGAPAQYLATQLYNRIRMQTGMSLGDL